MAPNLPARTNGPKVSERLSAAMREIARLVVAFWDRFERLVGRAPPIQGFVDALFQGEVVVGWVRDPDRTERRLEVVALQGDRVLGASIADLPRRDLVAAGYGDGRYGFRLRLTEAPDPLGGRVIRVCAQTEKGKIALQRGVIALPDGAQPTVAHEGPPIYIGMLERLEGTVLHGWAYNPDHPESAAIVDIFDDERFLGCATADRPRPKLLQQGLSTSARGFSFNLGLEPDVDMLQRIRARVAGTAFELTKAKGFLQPGTGSAPNPPERNETGPRASKYVSQVAAIDLELQVQEPAEPKAQAKTDSMSRQRAENIPVHGRRYKGKPAGLLLVSGNARSQDTAASATSWFSQSVATTIAIIAGDVRQEISLLLPDSRRDSVRWIDKTQKNALRDFLFENEFVVLARAGDSFDPDLAFTLHFLADVPDVVVWGGNGRSGREVKFETYLQHPPIESFAVRADVLLRYSGPLINEAQQGRLLPLRLWLAGQPDLIWEVIDTPVRRSDPLPSMEFDEGLREACARALADESWRLRTSQEDWRPVVAPQAEPKQVSLALWRGWDAADLTIISDPVLELKYPVQLLIPTGGKTATGEQRQAEIDRIALRSGAKHMYTKLVDCKDDPAESVPALLDAADSEVVIFADVRLNLADVNMPELFAWSLCDTVGVVAPVLETPFGFAQNAGRLLQRQLNPVPNPQKGEAHLADVIFGDFAVVNRQRAVVAGGFNGDRYGGTFQWLEFCLRLKQAGYYSVRLGHLKAGIPEATGYAGPLPKSMSTLLRSARLLEC